MTWRNGRPLPPWPTPKEIDAIRRDPELSEQGKRAAIEALYSAASPLLDPPTDRPDRRIHGY